MPSYLCGDSNLCFICKFFFRLPVGHTHEDIDACFGTIATWFGTSIIQNPQEYKLAVEKAFSGEGKKIKCCVNDVFVVSDYQSFFEDCIDTHFGRTHKLEWTQHQYCFEAVEISRLFPCGAKFTYRKYSSDKVVVINKKPALLCKTAIRRKTGKLDSLLFVNN